MLVYLSCLTGNPKHWALPFGEHLQVLASYVPSLQTQPFHSRSHHVDRSHGVKLSLSLASDSPAVERLCHHTLRGNSCAQPNSYWRASCTHLVGAWERTRRKLSCVPCLEVLQLGYHYFPQGLRNSVSSQFPLRFTHISLSMTDCQMLTECVGCNTMFSTYFTSKRWVVHTSFTNENSIYNSHCKHAATWLSECFLLNSCTAVTRWWQLIKGYGLGLASV